MSIEALRAEFKANLPISLAIKAADSQFFKSNRTYTNLPTEVTHKGGHHGKRNGHRKSSHVTSVREAIDEAKKTLDEARNKGGRSKHNSKNRHRRSTSGDNDLKAEVAQLKEENNQIKKDLAELKEIVQKLSGVCLGSSAKAAPAPAAAAAPAKEEKKDEDFDLFGSDEEEDAEAAKIREERLKAYAAKKANKPGPIAKSSVILDVKPWDDETDLKEMEKLVKSIEQDGLVWGATKLIPIGYGIQKLQIVSTIEDAKVSVDDLIEKIQDDFADHVQSVDIVAFNKI